MLDLTNTLTILLGFLKVTIPNTYQPCRLRIENSIKYLWNP